MIKANILLGAIIAFVVAFIGLRIFQQELIADVIRPVILPLVTIYYWMRVRDKRSYFFFFLLIYSIGEILTILYYYVPASAFVDNLLYFGCNLLYITAYVMLLLEVIKGIKVSDIAKRFSVHLLILLALDIYCVILVSDIAAQSDSIVTIYDYILEVVYNAVIMLLLTASLINYFFRDSKKAMNLLLGSICIVFSETIQVAYYYVSEIGVLSVAYSVLMVVAFYFFYIQAKMSYIESDMDEQHAIEQLKV